jgi:hypothetical protein
VNQEGEYSETETTESLESPDSGSDSASLPRWVSWLAFAGIFVVTLIAGISRLLQLDRYPGGMAEAEARHGVLARQSDDFGLQWAIENATELSIPLVIVISWAGTLFGYDAETPRIAAALFGTGSILCIGLWLNRAIGPLWGLAGAAVLAGSFWHILFSRLALGQIAGAFAIAALCWLLTEAATREGPRATPWYVLAGLVAGLGFLSTPALRLLPLVVLGALVVALVRLRQRPETSEARNWLIASTATYLTTSPFLIANRNDLQLWTPWTTPPGLPGDSVATFSDLSSALINSVTALVISVDIERGLNLPSDPWFSLLMLPWALIGVLGLINASNRPDLRDRFLVGSGIAGASVLGITVIDAGHPGQLVVISPALAGLVIFGFRTALRWARVRTVRVALAVLVVTGVVGEAVLSAQRYTEEWAATPETRAEFHADVVNTLAVVEPLDIQEPVFLAFSGDGTTLDYFRTTTRRHIFDSESVLPLPADEDGYLIIPEDEGIAPELARLLDRSESDTQALGNSSFQGYRLNGRLREEMPLSVPTVNYPNGPVLHGSSDLSQHPDNTARFIIAWKSDPESPAFTVESRLRTTGMPREEATSHDTLPPNPLRSRLFQVLVIEIDIPDPEMANDLEVRLRNQDGFIVPVAGMDDEGYLLLNQYTFQD